MVSSTGYQSYRLQLGDRVRNIEVTFLGFRHSYPEGRVVSESPVEAVTPAIQRANPGQCHRMIGPRANDRYRGKAMVDRYRAESGEIAQSELTGVIVAPDEAVATSPTSHAVRGPHRDDGALLSSESIDDPWL